MYPVIYLLAAATTAIIALVAIWAARSSLHWFWRAAALLTCFVLLVPVGAAELNLLFMPLAGILFLASAGQQWWERRRERLQAGRGEGGPESIRAEDPPIPATTGPNRLPTPSFRFSLKELFLILLLSAVAAWVVARIVQEGIVLDWRKLPIAVALVSAVAWTAFWWVDRPRPWPELFARGAAYLVGAATALLTMYALIYWLAWESALDITIASACFGCLAITGTYAWLRYHGGLLPAVILVAGVYFASYVHANYLGDWMSADYLLIEGPPTFWLVLRLMYGVLYALLAVAVLVGTALWRGATLPWRDSWRNCILSGASAAALLAALCPLAWLYWRLLDRPQLSGAAGLPPEGLLAEANRIVERIQEIRKAKAPPAASGAIVIVPPPDTPEMRRLTSDLFTALQDPSRAAPVSQGHHLPDKAEIGERQRLMGVAAQVFAAGYTDIGDNRDRAGEFALAQVRYADLAQRQALAADAVTAYAYEQHAHSYLALLRGELSPGGRRELLRALKEIEATREPLDALLARDAAWSERRERWRSRLRRVVLGREDSADTGRAFDSLREQHDACVAVARLNLAGTAIELFKEDRGRLPTSLEELVPLYLDAAPLDPYTGQPLAYHAVGGGYALYSVGSDRHDDGGALTVDVSLDPVVKYLQQHLARARAMASAKPVTTAQPGRKPASANDP